VFQTRLNIQEIAAPAAAPVQAVPVEAEEAPVQVSPLFCALSVHVNLLNHEQQDEPKEKTIFSVKLESFDAAAKPKIIREVKAIIPNLNLMDVRMQSFSMDCLFLCLLP
jgi:large subunit ribosomal protein L7/L12